MQDVLGMRCILGDIRLWVGDPSTSCCLVSQPRFSRPTLILSPADRYVTEGNLNKGWLTNTHIPGLERNEISLCRGIVE
jgi:hypothetical protein